MVVVVYGLTHLWHNADDGVRSHPESVGQRLVRFTGGKISQSDGQLESNGQRLSTVGSFLLKPRGQVLHLVEHPWVHSYKVSEGTDVAFSEMFHKLFIHSVLVSL